MEFNRINALDLFTAKRVIVVPRQVEAANS